ncbi:LysE family translocator [Microbacteriaceae bacterium K1510]|nr:LysE family translocator [Microbacteriaceae bacterium K1510]
MNVAIPLLFGYGFMLGWSVAWPPGPINAEIARRCLARGFWAGYGVLLGASLGDALWALVVVLGIGSIFTTQTGRFSLGVLSTILLLVLALAYLRGAWRSLHSDHTAATRFDSGQASLLLGLIMALTSPWNIAFWLAAIGRPEFAGLDSATLLIVVVAVISGALSWGLLWSVIVVVLHRSAPGRWWDVGARIATGVLMLFFAGNSIVRLIGG